MCETILSYLRILSYLGLLTAMTYRCMADKVLLILALPPWYDVQVSIHHHRVEMSDLHIKLIQERQKVEYQIASNEQLDSQLRDTLKELKVRRLKRHHLTIFLIWHTCTVHECDMQMQWTDGIAAASSAHCK